MYSTLNQNSFAVRIVRAVGRTVVRAMFYVSIGEPSFTDLDFADDVAFLTELYVILQSVLIICEEEASELG